MNATYLFKFGSYTIPNEYMAEDGYECTPNQRQDLDPFTDQFGVTHRNALQHTKTDITITFRDLKWSEFQTLISNIVSNYSIINERDAICTYLDMETFTMKEGHFYLDPSCKFQIRKLNEKVPAFTLRFTEY